MDKVFSTRLDESVLAMLDEAARQTGASKKSLLERAIRVVAHGVQTDSGKSAFTETSGAWANRLEAPQQTVDHARDAFRKSMLRHQQ